MATSTRTFGTSRRESHDASAFYGRGLATATFSDDATVADVPRRNLDRIYHHSSAEMGELPDNSVALMVTSPPYHAGKDFDSDASYPEFLALLEAVFAKVHRALEPGGRAVVNVANLGRKPYLALSTLRVRASVHPALTSRVADRAGSRWGLRAAAMGCVPPGPRLPGGRRR